MRLKTMLCKPVNTVARADRDIVLEPGTRSSTALPFKVGGCPSAMRAATVFSAMPVVKVKTRESLDPSPSLHAVGSEDENSQPSKEKGASEAEESNVTMTMMEHFVHPLVDPEDNVVKVYLPVANPGVDRLVIRKGEGYWSLLVRQCDRKHLAFNSETHGLMTFKRVPFGMATSGATMQRSMETILRGDTSGPEAYDRLGPILGELAQVYIDDISIWSTDNDHLDDLLRVMKVLKKNNVTLKLKKCVWCTDEAKLCGFEVRCGDGISADLEKVAGIAAITSLPDLGSLKSFLGSCVYLSRFIKDFATLTAPLYELEKQYKCLTTKINGARWEAQHQRSFEGVKAALASAPVLAFPNFDKPFILLSDCSEIAMGGVLLQIDDDGIERPIAYASRRLNQAEKNYKITAKEGAAGFFCVRKFRSYLLGQPTVWITEGGYISSVCGHTRLICIFATTPR